MLTMSRSLWVSAAGRKLLCPLLPPSRARGQLRVPGPARGSMRRRGVAAALPGRDPVRGRGTGAGGGTAGKGSSPPGRWCLTRKAVPPRLQLVAPRVPSSLVKMLIFPGRGCGNKLVSFILFSSSSG